MNLNLYNFHRQEKDILIFPLVTWCTIIFERNKLAIVKVEVHVKISDFFFNKVIFKLSTIFHRHRHMLFAVCSNKRSKKNQFDASAKVRILSIARKDVEFWQNEIERLASWNAEFLSPWENDLQQRIFLSPWENDLQQRIFLTPLTRRIRIKRHNCLESA